MFKDLVIENNKIGSAIQYFREAYHISQTKLCKGLCSVATLSRIEAGERDVDSLLLETLLERLGKTPNQFELILTDFDYELYHNREEIRKQIEDKNYNAACELLKEYEQIAASKGTVHLQFIITSKALLNELYGGTVETSIELFMEAITNTVPGFKTHEINDYYLSNSEMNIIIDVVQRMISVGMTEMAKEILDQVLEYLDSHNSMEENNRLYPKVAVIASRLFMQEQDLNRALEMCNKGLESNKGSRKMDYLGELSFLKAQATEGLLKAQKKLEFSQNECLKLYLQAYYIFDFCEDPTTAEKIKKYLEEEYKWEDID
ncbi:MAG: helix-turn-helix domain-containing protein [Mobilitalea sp.]